MLPWDPEALAQWDQLLLLKASPASSHLVIGTHPATAERLVSLEVQQEGRKPAISMWWSPKELAPATTGCPKLVQIMLAWKDTAKIMKKKKSTFSGIVRSLSSCPVLSSLPPCKPSHPGKQPHCQTGKPPHPPHALLHLSDIFPLPKLVKVSASGHNFRMFLK